MLPQLVKNLCPMTHGDEHFNTDRVRLLKACERLASALRTSDPASVGRLSSVAAVLRGPSDWELQARAVASLRGLFHRDGLNDRPPPAGASTWDEDLKTVWSLSTIYVEPRYVAAAAKRDQGPV